MIEVSTQRTAERRRRAPVLRGRQLAPALVVLLALATIGLSPGAVAADGGTVANAASAQSADRAGTVERPLYLEIVSGSDTDEALPTDLVEAMAREALSSAKRPVVSVEAGTALPAGVRVLRVMVLVSRQRDATGTVLAASANTSLFTTPAGQQRVNALYYQGMQQELTTGDARSAVEMLRGRFKNDLQQRIGDALAAAGGRAD